MSNINSVIEDEHESDHWISVADLMAGLMVIFLFIAISYVLFERKETDQIKILQKQNEQLKDALSYTTDGEEKLIQVKQADQIEILQQEQQKLKDALAEATNGQNESIQAEQAAQIEELQEENQQLETTIQNSEEQTQQKLEDWKEQITKIVKAQKIDSDIYNALEKEFKDDLPEWVAELSPDLTIRFKAPEVLFATGKNELKLAFKKILDNFIPRYLDVLAKFENSIEEIRIEGHTSSEWKKVSPIDAYFNNMELSQDRTRTVLEYSLTQTDAREGYNWARRLLTANGLSSSRLVKPDGIENPELSRRVEFKIRTKVKQEIRNEIDKLQ